MRGETLQVGADLRIKRANVLGGSDRIERTQLLEPFGLAPKNFSDVNRIVRLGDEINDVTRQTALGHRHEGEVENARGVLEVLTIGAVGFCYCGAESGLKPLSALFDHSVCSFRTFTRCLLFALCLLLLAKLVLGEVNGVARVEFPTGVLRLISRVRRGIDNRRGRWLFLRRAMTKACESVTLSFRTNAGLTLFPHLP